MVTTSEKNKILANLQYFSGSTNFYMFTRKIIYSEGVRYLAEHCDCYWLLDLINSWQTEKVVNEQEFQVYKLKVNPDHSATVTIEDGNYNILAIQNIEFTDFPLISIDIWFSNDTIYLPSEH